MSETQCEDLPVTEALRLLTQVRFGRVVFTSRALPAVRAVRHVVADSMIVIAAGPELVLGPPSPPSADGGTVVAYEADQLDSSGRSGWSVVVVGRARHVNGEAEIDLYRQLLSPVAETDQLIAISTDVVTGFRTSGLAYPVVAGK